MTQSSAAAAVPADIGKALQFGEPAPSGLSAEEKNAFDQLDFFFKRDVAYALEWAPVPRRCTELQAYPNLIFFNKHDKGGHFAAWEQPAYLTADLRAAFKTLR